MLKGVVAEAAVEWLDFDIFYSLDGNFVFIFESNGARRESLGGMINNGIDVVRRVYWVAQVAIRNTAVRGR